MRLDTSMSQRLEQKMFLAPRMIQSMEILQLAVMALQERIEHELQENPFLELREPGNDEEGFPDNPELAEVVEPPPQAEPERPETELVIDAKSGEQDFERMAALTADGWDFNEES